VAAGMGAVHPFLTGEAMMTGIQLKDDETIASLADHLSQEEMRWAFLGRNSGFSLFGEEGVQLYGPDGSLAAMAASGKGAFGDPLDGSRLPLYGFKDSTVICSVHDFRRQQQTAAAVGYPVSGEVFYADRGKTWKILLSTRCWKPKRGMRPVRCRVGHGQTGGKAAILIEHSAPFTRTDHWTGEKRLILDDEAMDVLCSELRKLGLLVIHGSNGSNQVAVASGLDVIGQITTAVGGPWDLVPLIIVNAGGFVYGLRVRHQRQFSSLEVRPSSLNTPDNDMQIGAVNRGVADALLEPVRAAVATMSGVYN
jgi:hypothetical protein